MHPEEFGSSYPHNAKASDIYAFGVLAWEARGFTELPGSFAEITPTGFYGTRCLLRQFRHSCCVHDMGGCSATTSRSS